MRSAGGGPFYRGMLHVGAAGPDAAPLAFSPAKYEQVRQLGAVRLSSETNQTPSPPIAGVASLPPPAAGVRQYQVNGVRATSLPMILVFSFLGGLILNVMPCVLPVIGLKILSFVEQGGHSPAAC